MVLIKCVCNTFYKQITSIHNCENKTPRCKVITSRAQFRCGNSISTIHQLDHIIISLLGKWEERRDKTESMVRSVTDRCDDEILKLILETSTNYLVINHSQKDKWGQL